MAQKYLMALDYADLHASSILRKHAKKRTLGDIETKHRYTPTQPVLSCRTVDIDVSGTRTYRPKSSADIISEQHAIIHKIYSKARNVASAPPKRAKTPRKNQEEKKNYENNLKSVEVQGRPLTSLSQVPPTSSGRSSKASKKRPKTTGTIKSDNNNQVTKDSFMLVATDKDLLETKRSHRSITQKIHKHWQPENHDLNTGTFQRGKKVPGVPSIDSWLSFSGSQAEDSEGIVDAFTDAEKQNEYYNIEGGVGSRIAQQLQGGNKIRVGINGTVQTDELRVRKWLKEESYVNLDLTENDEARKENMAKNDNIMIPLSWDDQVQSANAKVLTPRGPPAEKATINLCETRPVVFTKLIPDDGSQPGSSCHGKQKEGFRVRQRTKSKTGVDGKERDTNKLTVVTIDAKSEEEEKKIQSLTVDDVIKQTCKHIDRQNGRFDETEKHSVSFSLVESDNHLLQDSAYNQSKVSVSDSYSSTSSDYNKHPKVKPTQPTFSSKYQEVDLDIIGTLSVPNGTRPLSSETDAFQSNLYGNSKLPSRQNQMRMNSARSTRSSLKSAKSGQQKMLGSGSLVNVGSPSLKQNEAEYIQISHPMKNPNPMQLKKSTEFMGSNGVMSHGMSHETVRGHRATSGIREPVPSPELENYEDRDEHMEHPVTPSVTMKPVIKSATPALSINIPTADYTDSALNSPSHKAPLELETSPQMRRAKDMRDEQIDQITTLLVDAIIDPNDEKIGKTVTEKS